LHWVSCITGGLRLYKEALTGTVLPHTPHPNADVQDVKDAIDDYVKVPMGVSAFPRDFVVPRGLSN